MCSRAAACALALLLGSVARAADLPVPAQTPGALNPDVTQRNVQQTLCTKGWPQSVRPAARYTSRLKRAQLRAMGLGDRPMRDFEEDHLIPLALGGHPSDPRNLWPQPRRSRWNAALKDDLEFVLYRMVCRHEIGLAPAQTAIATDWIAAYRRYVPTHPRDRRGHGFSD